MGVFLKADMMFESLINVVVRLVFHFTGARASLTGGQELWRTKEREREYKDGAVGEQEA